MLCMAQCIHSDSWGKTIEIKHLSIKFSSCSAIARRSAKLIEYFTGTFNYCNFIYLNIAIYKSIAIRNQRECFLDSRSLIYFIRGNVERLFLF